MFEFTQNVLIPIIAHRSKMQIIIIIPHALKIRRKIKKLGTNITLFQLLENTQKLVNQPRYKILSIPATLDTIQIYNKSELYSKKLDIQQKEYVKTIFT